MNQSKIRDEQWNPPRIPHYELLVEWYFWVEKHLSSPLFLGFNPGPVSPEEGFMMRVCRVVISTRFFVTLFSNKHSDPGYANV